MIQRVGVAALTLFALAWLGPGNSLQADVDIRLGSGEERLETYRDYGYTAAVVGDFTRLATYAEIAPQDVLRGALRTAASRLGAHPQSDA